MSSSTSSCSPASTLRLTNFEQIRRIQTAPPCPVPDGVGNRLSAGEELASVTVGADGPSTSGHPSDSATMEGLLKRRSNSRFLGNGSKRFWGKVHNGMLLLHGPIGRGKPHSREMFEDVPYVACVYVCVQGPRGS